MEVPLAAETVFHIGKFPITNSLLMSWLAISTLAIIAVLGTRKMALIPGRFQNLLELIVEAADNMITDIAGARGRAFLPLVATFFIFILASNWLGLLPGLAAVGFWEEHEGHNIFVPLLRPGNSDLNVTLALGLISVAATQFFGIRFRGIVGYFKHYFHNPLSGGIAMVIGGLVIGAFVGFLEIISEFVKIISLSFRLFGNIYAGEAVLTTVSGLISIVAPIPFMMLEFLVGIVQATVFGLLTLVFLSIITNKHEDHGHTEEKQVEHITNDIKTAAASAP